MKTAMQQLKERLLEIGFTGVEPFINEYIETEKQQIIDLCTEAYEMGLGHKEYSATDTYTSTFTTNKETLK